MDLSSRRAVENQGFDGDWRLESLVTWERVCQAEKIEWCCKRTGDAQVISEDQL